MSSQSHHILVVDDLADNTFLLEAFLLSEGYTVDVANTASSALEKMQVRSPDLVLLDVMMPNMDGYELTRTIRRDDKLHTIPIVLLTAHNNACRVKGLAAGATDFVRKPIDFDKLLSILQHLIAAQKKLRR